MLEAARRQSVEPERVSFIDALDVLRYRAPSEPIPKLLINPRRPDRDQPRVIKRRKDRHRLMTKPRSEYHSEVIDDESLAA